MTGGLGRGFVTLSQYVIQNLKTFEGKQNATLIPVLSYYSGFCCKRQLSPFSLEAGQGGQGALPTLKGSPSWRGSVRLLPAEWVRCAGSYGLWNP